MEIDDLFPSKYLRGSDLQGHVVNVKISRAALEKFYDQETRSEVEKLVIYFTDKKKGLILGKGLAYQVAEICGSKNTDAWTGKELVLYSEKRLVYGQEKDVIRARAKVESGSGSTF